MLIAYLANLRKGVYHNGTVVDGKYVKGNFNGKKPIIYIMQVIEYQNRGLESEQLQSHQDIKKALRNVINVVK
jgi:hypothetical protein